MAEAFERGLAPWVVGEAQSAETPWVGEGESSIVIEGQLEFQKTRRLGLGLKEMKVAGHAEMKNRPGLAVELEPEVFPEAPGVFNGGAAKRLFDLSRRSSRKNDRILMAVRGDNTPAFEVAERGLTRGFDLRQLGQGELFGVKALQERLNARVARRPAVALRFWEDELRDAHL